VTVGHTVAVRRLLAVLPLLAVLVACSGNDDHDGASAAPGPSPTKSITMVPLPPKAPPTGKLIADIEQWSLDAANARFEVYIDNDTDATIKPIRVSYRDDRFRTPLPGTRLRDIPSQSRRGFPIYIPDQPACDRTASSGTVTVDYTVHGEKKSSTVPVSDVNGVVQRVASARCIELSVAQIAHLSWADEVTASGDGGKGSVGALTLVIDTTGNPGHTLVIDTITGNPLFSPGDLGVYKANITITGDQPPRREQVPILPARCDAHAFGESGNFAAFAFNVHLDGQPGQFILRMNTTTARNAIHYAKASCGFLVSIGGGKG
jgi:hypothetical protein